MIIQRFRKKPIEVQAVRWMGGEWSALDDFCGFHWRRADAVDEEAGYEDPEKVVVWNTVQRQYLRVYVGSWIIRGINGELYPCEAGIFEATYEPA